MIETELKDREQSLANRELTVSIGEAAMDFFDRIGGLHNDRPHAMPVEPALNIFRSEVKAAYALRRRAA